MNCYLEITEELALGDIYIKQPQQIRVVVMDKDDALAKLPKYELVFAGLKYTKQIHICNHDAGQPCIVETL